MSHIVIEIKPVSLIVEEGIAISIYVDTAATSTVILASLAGEPWLLLVASLERGLYYGC